MEKILIIRFSSIGDIIFTTSIIEGLKDTFNCQIDFLTLNTFVPILESNPNINRVISFPKNLKILDLIEYGILLNKERYSKVFDLHGSLRSIIISLLIKKSIYRRYKKPRFKRFLLFYLKINLFKKDFELTNELLSFTGISKKYLPKTYISINEKINCKQWLKGKNLYTPFITLVPGSTWPNKLWNTDKYRQFLMNLNCQVIVLGSKTDFICKEISDGFNHVANLQGLTDLRTSMTIINLSETVIGADTGLLHIAESLGVPIIMLSGPTSNYTGGNARLPGSYQLFSDVWCRPCSKDGSRKCFRSNRFCLSQIKPQLINNTLNKILSNSN